MTNEPKAEAETTCDRCGRPVADGAHCCTPCCDQTRVNLEFITENAGDLEVTLTRQDRVSSGTGGRASAETPLPVNLRASDIGHRLRNTLTTAARLVIEERGLTMEEAFPTPDPPAGPICRRAAETWCAHLSCRAIVLAAKREPTDAEIARFLHRRVNWIAHSPWGPGAFDDIGRDAVDLARAIDSPPPMISLGKCDTDGCSAEIRAHQEATFATCRECRTSYDVVKRKDRLLGRADHLRRNAASIARILTALGDLDPDGNPVVRDAKWVYNRVQRQQLHPVGVDEAGHPVYNLGAARRLHDQSIKQAILKKTKAESEAAA